MTNWLATGGPVAGLTVIGLELAVKKPALVLKPMVIVSTVLYDRPLNAATPLANVAVKSLPCRLEVPVFRAAVTVCVLSLVMTFPKKSSSPPPAAWRTPDPPWPSTTAAG